LFLPLFKFGIDFSFYFFNKLQEIWDVILLSFTVVLSGVSLVKSLRYLVFVTVKFDPF
jgi:hypothetical protein